ncbi:LIM and SH3 domain protein F42H10.3-like [Dendronephthya gigantea]|uniref:LIM and SH3 domain protein F42H10.3-like n=1 Tax=Dendronephthya gigantea TaxID=151771 RepID=UPI00106C6690|nr:LIM and SH3 domain protein F42H10.3-like [Dendronephthya gigantea]
MSSKCAGCTKTVYPVEQLKCLDQIWHKKCFKCAVCGMTLTMKNYKGYEKRPYCSPHYPTTKFTVVSDTPENLRLAKQSKQQSQVEYHKKFAEEKGHYTAVADDPETERAKRVAKQASQLQYTADARQPAENRPAPAPAHVEPPPEPMAPVSVNIPAPADPGRSPPPVQERYRAVYDYDKADSDEISLKEGDMISDGKIVGEGWMEGTNMRTGETGMLPSNYVEKV